MVRTYATHTPSSGKFSVFLINKDTAPRSASVAANSGSAHFLVDTWIFSGASASDLYPRWVHNGQSSAAGNLMSVTLAPVSVTVLDVTPVSPVHAVPGTIQAEDFRDGGYWDSTTGNYGNRYRTTDVDIEGTGDSGGGFGVGWIAPGEWLEYAIHVQTAGSYDLSARVASPYTGKSFRVSVNGQPVASSVAVPRTGA